MRKRPIIDWLRSKLKKEKEEKLDPEDKKPVVEIDKKIETWLEWIYRKIDEFLKKRIFSK